MVLKMSPRDIGHQPSSRRASRSVASALDTTTKRVMMEQMMLERVTARTLALIDEGASRDSWGEGLVALER